jgi:signal transduction histidine kinase
MTDGQEVRLETPAEPLVVLGDARRLQQVMFNLISNALQHGASERGVDVRLWRKDEHAILEVVDYGQGIPPEDREHVFERFFTTDAQSRRGLGVGLYLVHAIVIGHSGTVDVHSAGGRGTTFTVQLPIAQTPM